MRLPDLPFMERFYLAGGTALSLQIGHRLSVDLDFFTTNDEIHEPLRQEISQTLFQIYPNAQIDAGLGGMVFTIQNNFISFYSYSYPLLKPTINVEKIALASITDIALMKMDAVAGRGSRKDFVDLYFIAQQHPLETILEQSHKKYPHVRDFPMIALTSLTDFTNAEQQKQIETTPLIPWQNIKLFFKQEVQRIGRNWFE